MALKALRRHASDLFVYTHACPYYIPDLRNACGALGVPYSLHDISKSSLPFKPDIIASVYYRNIFSPTILDIVEGKAFNLHPSLLPQYRGCSSLSWALINGDAVTGYTYHYMNAGIDKGDILLQRSLAIYPWDTGESLYNRVMFSAMEDFENVLYLVISGYPGTPQKGQFPYYRRGCPFNGEINDEWPDEFVERFIRALIFPPLPPAHYKGRDIYDMKTYKALRSLSNRGLE